MKPTKQPEPLRPWLIQRLNKPIEGEGPLAKLVNAFSFGGGLANGGLSKDDMKMLQPIMSFDYMGSAEFEWGALPKALQAIAQAKKLVAGECLSEFGFPNTYFICDEQHREKVIEFLKSAAENEPR